MSAYDPTIRTVGELKALLAQFSDETKIAINDSGGNVTIMTAAREKLYVAAQDRTFATVGRYLDRDGKFCGMTLGEDSECLFIDTVA